MYSDTHREINNKNKSCLRISLKEPSSAKITMRRDVFGQFMSHYICAKLRMRPRQTLALQKTCNSKLSRFNLIIHNRQYFDRYQLL